MLDCDWVSSLLQNCESAGNGEQVNSSGNTSALYSGGAQFKYQPGHQLSVRLFLAFLSFSRSKYQDCTSNYVVAASFQAPSNSLFSNTGAEYSEVLTVMLSKLEIGK